MTKQTMMALAVVSLFMNSIVGWDWFAAIAMTGLIDGKGDRMGGRWMQQ